MRKKQENTAKAANPLPQYPRNARETKKRILETAMLLFAQDVYKNVSTREIAAAAGVNVNLINRYFGSKKGLFTAIVMSFGNGSTEIESSKEQILMSISNFLNDTPSRAKEIFRLVLLSALDSNVSDVMATYYLKRQNFQTQLLTGDDKETRAVIADALAAGIAFIFILMNDEKRNSINKDQINAYYKKLFHELYF
jgi:AcrR family transcriptional regulator